MPETTSTAFDITQSALQSDFASYEDIALWLCRELDNARDARGSVASDIKDNWTRYEQGRTRGTSAPWPDAADLTSPITAEFVDALHARVMDTIFSDHVWTVEGWGPAAQRAPFVEEFHQRTLEEERLQDYLDEVLLRAWNEPAGILEVSEAFEMRREIQRKRVKLQLDELTGTPIIGEDNKPVLARDPESGDFLDAEGDEPSADADVDAIQPVRLGPAYDVVPYLDFLTLPNHARSRDQIWGYAKRFWRRVPELTARVKLGIYDKHAVEELGAQDERQSTISDDVPSTKLIPTQLGPLAQKELWEVQCLADFDGKGERWWRATVHKDRRQLLRLKFDDRTTRYIRFVPYKKPGSVDGYTLSGHKLITVQEEDTAVRNMRADMAAMAIAAPILRRTGALWDPYEQPLGPKAVIDVNDPQELTQLQLRDVPNSINIWKEDIRRDADRLVGQNDTSLGVDSREDNTLGEERLRAGYAEVRVNMLIKRLKEPMEDLWQARHAIWKRVLSDQQNGALPIMQRTVIGMQANGLDVQSIVADGRIGPHLLEGSFWGKPKGSVESADKQRQRQDFNMLLQQLPAALQVWPMLAALLNTPQATKAVLERLLYVNNWSDKQAFLGSEAHGVLQQQGQEQAVMADPRMKMLLAMANGVEGGALAGTGGGAPAPAPDSGAPPPILPQGVM